MSLELINVGAEANDGTGDTPRAAGVKMNAAIAVVNTLAAAPAPVDYSGAIAAIETTQGTQAGAIAALALDVDALETSQAGQDSAIAALASDVAALEAAPPSASGWDYIGPTEPIAPAVGFTWWEKVGGLTVGRWEWSSSLWIGILVVSQGFINTSIGSNTIVEARILSVGNIFLTSFSVDTFSSSIGIDSLNYWEFGIDTYEANRFNFASNKAAILTASSARFDSGTNLSTTRQINTLTNAKIFRFQMYKTGTAPNLSPTSGFINYKLVR